MKRKIYIAIYTFVMALLLAAEVFLVYSALYLDMLPDLYVVILISVLVLLLGGVGALLFVHRKGKWIGIARQIIACVIVAAVVAGSVYVGPKLLELRNTVVHITTNEAPTASRSIYVPVDDPAQSVSDISGYKFGYLQTDESCAKQIAAALQEKLGVEINLQAFENESLLIVAYNNHEVNALILNPGFLSVWSENELYVDFEKNNRVIYSQSVTESAKEEQAAKPGSEQTIQPVQDITNTPFVVYLSGMDGYSKLLTNTRSDVNILMVVNPSTKQILMVNTPRDYYVVHPWGNGGRDKLTHCGIYGIDCSIDAVENLYNTTVNYYLQINFSGFETMVDAIGGITVYSDHGFVCGDANEVYISQGENNLDGHQALSFARDRYHQPGGDNGRGQNQMKVIKAVIGKIANARTLIANYAQILKSLEGMLATSMSTEDLTKLVKMQLSDMATWNVLSYAVTGYGDTETTYSMPGTASYVMRPNQNTVDYGQELIQRVINGEILTQEDMKVPS